MGGGEGGLKRCVYSAEKKDIKKERIIKKRIENKIECYKRRGITEKKKLEEKDC